MLSAARTVTSLHSIASIPTVQYTNTPAGHHLAYQFTEGSGIPVVLLAGLATHCEGIWSAPGFSEWVEAAFSGRPVLMFDKRCTGLSDPVPGAITDQDLVDDACAVLDSAGVDRAVIVCAAEAAMFGPHIAGRRPGVVAGVVFVNATPLMFATDDFPHGLPEQTARAFGESVRESWARDDIGIHLAAPEHESDHRFRQWADRYQRLCATPGTIWQLAQYTAIGDGRDAIEQLGCPSLVIQSRHSKYFRPSNADWIASAAGVTPLWLNAANHLFWLADPPTATAAISDFLSRVDWLLSSH